MALRVALSAVVAIPLTLFLLTSLKRALSLETTEETVWQALRVPLWTALAAIYASYYFFKKQQRCVCV
jgi:hypothetical protein